MNKRTQNGLSFLGFVVLLAIIGVGLYIWRPDLFDFEDLSIESPTHALLGKGISAITDLKSLKRSMEWYALELGNYPSSAQGLDVLIDNPVRAFVEDESALLDPRGRPYRYQRPGRRSA